MTQPKCTKECASQKDRGTVREKKNETQHKCSKHMFFNEAPIDRDPDRVLSVSLSAGVTRIRDIDQSSRSARMVSAKKKMTIWVRGPGPMPTAGASDIALSLRLCRGAACPVQVHQTLYNRACCGQCMHPQGRTKQPYAVSRQGCIRWRPALPLTMAVAQGSSIASVAHQIVGAPSEGCSDRRRVFYN